jgi:hypothetical protein
METGMYIFKQFRAAFIARIGGVVAGSLLISPFAAHAHSPCQLTRLSPSYTMSSDTIEWSMIIRTGESCVRGIRYGAAIVDEVKLVTTPQFGQVTLQGTAFYYQAAPEFHGADAFALSVSGKVNQIPGSSTIRVLVSIM